MALNKEQRKSIYETTVETVFKGSTTILKVSSAY